MIGKVSVKSQKPKKQKKRIRNLQIYGVLKLFAYSEFKFGGEKIQPGTSYFETWNKKKILLSLGWLTLQILINV